MDELFFADDLTDFDENGSVVPSETSIRQSEFIEKLIADIRSGKVEIDMSEEVFNEDDEAYYPKWREDDNFIYALDPETFTYLPLIEADSNK